MPLVPAVPRLGGAMDELVQTTSGLPVAPGDPIEGQEGIRPEWSVFFFVRTQMDRNQDRQLISRLQAGDE